MKKLRTLGRPQSRSLGWLQEKVDQLLKDRQERLSQLREQQQHHWPMPPDMPEMFPLPHDPVHEQGEHLRRNHIHHESPGASQRHESPHRHRMNPTESPRQREFPPVPPWVQEWPDLPQSQNSGPSREPEVSQNFREWLLQEWDYEDIPPPRHLLERRESAQRRAPHLGDWPPTDQWEAPRHSTRKTQDLGESPQMMNETKEVERAKVNAAKSSGRRYGKRRRNNR